MWSWWIVWATLAFAVVVPLAAAVRTGRLGLRLWRDLTGARGMVFDELDRLAAAADAAAARAEELAGGSERLSASVVRLARSRRRLAVLEAAWDEVGASLAAVTAFYPRKRRS